MVGGKRNSNVVAALLENFSLAEEVVEDSANAAGSALAENEKYLESIQGHIAEFSAAFEDAATSVIDSNGVKLIVDFGTELLRVLDAIAQLNLLLPITAGLLTTAFAKRRASGLSDTVQDLMGAITDKDLTAESDRAKDLARAYSQLGMIQREYVGTLLEAKLASQGYTRQQIEERLASLGITATKELETNATKQSTGAKIAEAGATQAQTAANTGLLASIKALLLSNPVGWILTILSFVPMLISAYQSVHKSNDELIQDAKDLESSYKQAFDEIDGSLDTLRGMQDEFAELSKGVDEYGNNISLSADDYERYLDIVETVLDTTPSLISGYDEEGRAIANKNRLLEESIALMEEERRIKADEYTSNESLATLLGGEVADIEEAMKNIRLPESISTRTQVLPDGSLQHGVLGRTIADEIADIIGVEHVAGEGIPDYILRNAELIEQNMKRILQTLGQDVTDDAGNVWKAYTDVQLSSLEDYLTSLVRVAQSASDSVRNSLQLVPQTSGVYEAYAKLTDTQKDFLSQYINTFDVTADTTEEDVLRMRDSIEDLTRDIADNRGLGEAIDLGISLQNRTDEDGNPLSVEEYANRLQEFLDQLRALDTEARLQIGAVLTFDEDSTAVEVGKAVDHIKNIVNASAGEIEAYVRGMSVEDILNIYYNLTADPNSMTLEEFKRAVQEIGVDWAEMQDVWDFTGLSDQLDGVEEKFNSLVEAMSSLKEGTALTVGELAKLALEYPELLKVSNLFADTSIENQQNILEAVLKSYEAEHDAYIDAKIAELEATNELINSQINLENEKKNKVIAITDLQHNGQLDSLEDYQAILNELRDLEGKNYVTFSNGILDVNEDMLEQRLAQEGQATERLAPLFGAQGDMIAEANIEGLGRALGAFSEYQAGLGTWARTSLVPFLSGVSTEISNALSGKEVGTAGPFRGVQKSAAKVKDEFVRQFRTRPIGESIDESAFGIDEKSVDEWAANYERVIEERVKTLTEQIEANNTIIDNLKQLRDLDLMSIYGDAAGGSGSGSGVDEYIAEIDRYREAIERLSRIQIGRSALEESISNSGDLKEQIALREQLIDVYREEQGALHTLNDLRDQTISNGAEALRQLGFEVEYDADNNRFFVENLEHLNELVATSRGDYETMQEATNALREETEDFIDSLEELNEANQEGSESWWSLQYSIEEAKDSLVEGLKEIVAAASDAVDEIQNVYDVLHTAADEYAAGGYIMIDTLQDIINLGANYMQLLMDENGHLVINEERINAVIAAKTRQLAVENALSYVESLRLALEGKSNQNLDELLGLTQDVTDATWAMVYANLAALDLTDSQRQAALHNINALRMMAENAIAGIGSVADSTTTTLEDMRTGLDDILEYVMDMLQHRIEQQIDDLEDMKDSYREIIELRKESLQAAKEEEEYQDSVADKVQELADLQERINALSLDDSREAQSQRVALEEEMAELQKELADQQADYAMNAQTDALDDMADAYDEEKDKEIEILEDSISSQQKLYDMAIAYIQSNWDTLYTELLEEQTTPFAQKCA